MFTGIITDKAIAEVVGPKLVLKMVSQPWTELVPGESIAVDGVCLSLVSFETRGGDLYFSFDLSPETLRLTQEIKIGEVLNLERALRASDRLGGHIVQGHVDETGVIHSVEHGHEWTEVVLRTSLKRSVLVPKGSIAVNGVSLTVNRVTHAKDHSLVHLMIIPITLEKTNIGQLKVEDEVNVEFDSMAKQMAAFLEASMPHIKES